MLNNFIYVQSKAMFEERIAEVPNEAIVFIEDTKEIGNHGTYFAGEPDNSEIFQKINALENIVLDLEAMGDPIHSTEEANYYSQNQLEQGSGMSISEIFDKLSTSNLVLKLGTVQIRNAYYIAFDGQQYSAYYSGGENAVYNLVIESTPVDEGDYTYSMQFTMLSFDNEIDFNTSQVISHDSSDTNVTLTHGAIHNGGEINSLQLTIPADNESEEKHYKCTFIPGEDFTLVMPESIRGEGCKTPTFEPGYQYELHIQGNRCLYAQFNLPQ